MVVWDELGGVLHSGTVFGPPYMRGERLLRKLPPGDARHKRRGRKSLEEGCARRIRSQDAKGDVAEAAGEPATGEPLDFLRLDTFHLFYETP